MAKEGEQFARTLETGMALLVRRSALTERKSVSARCVQAAPLMDSRRSDGRRLRERGLEPTFRYGRR